MSDLIAGYHRHPHQLYHLDFCDYAGKANQHQGMKAALDREV
jgi:hypothetical protein